MFALPLLCCLAAFVLYRLLARPPRATEGLAIAALVPALALLAAAAWNGRAPELDAAGRCNVNRAGAESLAVRTGAPLELAQAVAQRRDARPGRRFSSLSQIPVLGAASLSDRKRLERLGALQNWAALRAVAHAGLPPEPATGWLRRTPRRAGLFPELDIRARAAELLPSAPLDLEHASRHQMAAFFGDAAIAQRVAQFRSYYPSQSLHLSDIPALPRSSLILRSSRAIGRTYAALVGALLVLMVLGHLCLRAKRPSADSLLWPLFGGLMTLGVIVLFAAAPPLTAGGSRLWGLSDSPEFAGQGVAAILALALLPLAPAAIRAFERLGARRIPGVLVAVLLLPNVLVRFGLWGVAAWALVSAGCLARIWRRVALRWEMATLTAAVTVLALARLAGGHAGYAPLMETAKLALVVFTARLCADHEPWLGGPVSAIPVRARTEFALAWTAAMALAYLSNDLGLLLVLWLPCILIVSAALGARWPALLGGVATLAGGALLASLGVGRVPGRIAMWLHPFSAPSAQMAGALQRIASVPSVIAGLGIGRGSPLDVTTDLRDLVLPLYFEQLGFAGLAVVIGLYLLLIYRLLRVGLRLRSPFLHWLALAFGVVFGAQTVIMAGACFNLWPLTGLTLAPLASGKVALLLSALPVWAVLWASGEAPAPVTARPARARLVAWSYAPMALLLLLALAQAGRLAALGADATALRRVGGRENRRVAAERSSLSAGAILARRDGASYAAANLVPLAQDATGGAHRRQYAGGAAVLPITGVWSPWARTGAEWAWRRELCGLEPLLDQPGMPLHVGRAEDLALLRLWRRQRHPLWPALSPVVQPQNQVVTPILSLQTDAYHHLANYLQGSHFRGTLRSRKGAILMADVHTGEILAEAQWPSADPSRLTSSWSHWDAAIAATPGLWDKNGNLLDFIRNTDRAPGSTAKINTMMALEEAGQGGRVFLCAPWIRVHGHTIREYHNEVHGWVDVRRILQVSCNRGAAQAAAVVGPARLLALYRRLRYSLPGVVDPDATFRDHYEMIAFGQVIPASLREILTSACAVARGGEAIRLHARHDQPGERWRVCSPASAAAVAGGMQAAAEPGGTAWVVYRGRYDWPSKTGSAEVLGASKTDAWFVGYAPADSPRVAFAAWVEEDGTGGHMAAGLHLPALVEEALRMAG